MWAHLGKGVRFDIRARNFVALKIRCVQPEIFLRIFHMTAWRRNARRFAHLIQLFAQIHSGLKARIYVAILQLQHWACKDIIHYKFIIPQLHSSYLRKWDLFRTFRLIDSKMVLITIYIWKALPQMLCAMNWIIYIDCALKPNSFYEEWL